MTIKRPMLNAIIHSLVTSESALQDADGQYVSLKWVSNRLVEYITSKAGELCGFLLYDITKEHLYIHMVWVHESSRRGHVASTMMYHLLQRHPKLTVLCYANPQGRKLFKSLGFAVGKMPYRECILRRG